MLLHKHRKSPLTLIFFRIQTYSCFDTSPSKFCGDTYDDLRIKLTTPSRIDPLPGSFTLKVTTKNANQGKILIIVMITSSI